jgi:uncharacterized membrane protein
MALYAALKAVHLLSLMAWMGGMFFTLVCLRPAAATLPPPMRLPFMQAALGRFFNVVGVSALLALGSGAWMISKAVSATRQTGAPFNTPLEWWLMAGLGMFMVLIFGHIRFALYKRLQRAVAAQDWPAGGAALTSIRAWVSINLTIGTVIVVVTLIGEVG